MRKPQPKPGGVSAPTAGYPEIEALIDSEKFDDVNQAFTTAYESLSQVVSKKRGLKTNREAKKALKAIELTMDLFRELLRIKYQLKEQLAQPSKLK